MALQGDGNMLLWGMTSPPPPVGLSNVVGIAAGHGFAAAIAGDGSPVFTLQPFGQTATRGGNVQFHARATGVGPLSYQWQLDGVNLPSATNASLTLTNIQGRDAGEYRVIASNALANVASTKAALTISFSADLATALNATNLVWTTNPTNAPWFAQIRETRDGDVAAQSGPIGHNQQSTLQTTVVGPGTLTFWWKVSSEEGYDLLMFHADFISSIRAISGETDWQQMTMPIPSGSHVVRWVYSKDATVSAGRDAGWVDEVVFAPVSPLVLTAPRLWPDGTLAFTSSGAGGQSLSAAHLAFFEAQASTNLRDWITLANVCSISNGTLLVRDPDGVQHPRRFYRIVEHWP